MKKPTLHNIAVATTMATVLAASVAAAIPTAALAQTVPNRPVRASGELSLSAGTGQMVRLPAAISDLFVADDKVADVQVRSSTQIYIFAKAEGITTIFATDKAGRTVYSTNVRVISNVSGLDELLHAAMPEAQIQARQVNGVVLLTGTVATPADIEQATSLVQGVVGENAHVVTRLKSATPLQVMLQVKVAEVSRSLVKEIGMNLLSKDSTGGFRFGVAQGGGIDTTTGQVIRSATGTTLAAVANVFGMNLTSALNLAENDGRSHTLAEPNLTALSGETASFLAGGEFPIVMSNGISGNSVEYKQYGVSLAFTPTVLEGGRISMRVRPEVSQLSDQGAITLNGFKIPALTTRRTETTVELGSGQSFMIAGLLSNSTGNSTEKAPFLGSLPILGALFKSNSFKRSETELVIVVTPYLVRPVNAGEIALPTDGYRAPRTLERVFLGTAEHRTGEPAPRPTVVPAQQSTPAIGQAAPALPAPDRSRPPQQVATRVQSASPAPGFSF
jgi:pilus assembly protein CpaC